MIFCQTVEIRSDLLVRSDIHPSLAISKAAKDFIDYSFALTSVKSVNYYGFRALVMTCTTRDCCRQNKIQQQSGSLMSVTALQPTLYSSRVAPSCIICRAYDACCILTTTFFTVHAIRMLLYNQHERCEARL